MNQLFRRKSIIQIQKDVDAGFADVPSSEEPSLKRVLSVKDLTFFGIAAIVGAGIFSTIGKASFDGGPGIVLLFLFVSITCGFCALCYAEFASMVPLSGSAYTYAYVAFGELLAWIIGWDLLMEYAIGNIAVAISWSDYFSSLMAGFGLPIPPWLCMDYWTAKAAASPEAASAWANAPQWGRVKLICDLPAFLITLLITWVIYIGIKESRRMTNIMVWLKLIVIILVIVAGAFYVRPENWSPFLPNGLAGVMGGTAAVFFSYIGFDAISTTAEESKNPQRDLPRAMFYSLVICTIIYIFIAFTLTGMTSYSNLDVGDPLAHVFTLVGLDSIAGIVAVSAIIATASVLLVFQMGQPRIWLAMSRDGLLPKVFSKIHPRYQTPSFSTILTGVVVGIPALFLNLETVVDLTSVGTLFAFALVCGGVIRLQQKRKMQQKGLSTGPEIPESRFKIPYISARLWTPLLFVAALIIFYIFYPGGFAAFIEPEEGKTGWAAYRGKVPYVAFAIIFLITAVLSFIHRYSLIPVLGFLSCSYLLCESGTSNWERFMIWLLIGLIIYFLYGKKHSKLRTVQKGE